MTVNDLKFSKEHEWVFFESSNTVLLGISEYAQDSLGDIVYLDLPEVGSEIIADEVFGTVESVKAVSDLFSPFSGEVVEINEELDNSPELVNSNPYDKGWILRLKVDENNINTSELMSYEEYTNFLEN